MKKKLCSLLFCLSFFATAHAQLSGAYTARLQHVWDSVCTRYNLKGASAAVVVPGVGAWRGAYGISAAGSPIDTTMLFGIGSNTKTYIATLMLKLQEEGLVSLDDTIGTWIQNQPNISGQITIRQLLAQRSGLYSYTNSPAWQDSVFADYNRIWQPEDALQFVGAPGFAPGTSWEYSNTNYLLAGLIIKHIMAQPVSTTLRDKMLTPQNFSNTFFFPEETPTASITHPWSSNGDYLVDLVTDYGYSNNSDFSMAYTAGAIMATAQDNANFWQHLISGQIISSASIAQMLQYTHIGASGGHPIGYGLGIFSYQHYFSNHTIYEHGGTNVGYIAENAVDSVTGVAISVLTNQDSIDNSTLFNYIVHALHNVTVQVDPTAVNNVASADAGISVYPNPASNIITISNTGKEKLTLYIYDATGRMQRENNVTPGITQVPLSTLPAGIYIVELRNAQNTIINTQKLELIK